MSHNKPQCSFCHCYCHHMCAPSGRYSVFNWPPNGLEPRLAPQSWWVSSLLSLGACIHVSQWSLVLAFMSFALGCTCIALALLVGAHPAYGTTDRPVLRTDRKKQNSIVTYIPLMTLQHIPHPARSNHAGRCNPHPLTVSVRPVSPMRTKYRVYFVRILDDYQACTLDAFASLGHFVMAVANQY